MCGDFPLGDAMIDLRRGAVQLRVAEEGKGRIGSCTWLGWAGSLTCKTTLGAGATDRLAGWLAGTAVSARGAVSAAAQ